MESLLRLKSLHQDLIAFTQTNFANVERLWNELEESIQEFRNLLDKPAQDKAERESIASGKIAIDDVEYQLSDEIVHISRAIASALDLGDTEATKLLIDTHGVDIRPEPILLPEVVKVFHDRRDFLIQDLRILLQEAVDPAGDDGLQDRFRELVSRVLGIRPGNLSNGSAFARKCLGSLQEIEQRYVKISDQLQTKAILLEARGSETYQTLEFQRESLFKQHEALAAILAYLFRGNYTTSEDLRVLISVPQRWARVDFFLVHYLPAFSAAFRQYGSPDHSSTIEDASSIHDSLARYDAQTSQTALRPFRAVMSLWWVSEYSGWFREPSSEGTRLNSFEAREKLVSSALEDNALEFLLSLCTSLNFDVWKHPARHELVALLLSDTNGLSFDDEPTSDFFRNLIMECLEAFAEAWITNMPDSIRQLKSHEDDQRLQQLTAMQDELNTNGQPDHLGRLHLECFLVLISFAFEGRPGAAEEVFWQDPDGNLFGFLGWASMRQTVPRVGAFCEMLASLSEGPTCAAAAHKFLLDDATNSSSRTRRNPSMNYHQMFAELDLYARKVHERPIVSQLPQLRKILATDMNELESPVMLSCYLRLITHLCQQTSLTRDLIFTPTTIDLPDVLLRLCSGPVPSYLRGCIFQTLESLLTDKTLQVSSTLWKIIDNWASVGYVPPNVAATKSDQTPMPSMATLQNTLNMLSNSFDQSDAFVLLLCSLMTPSPDGPTGGAALPFPLDLGASYRVSGITPYVDFVCGQIFAKRLSELSDLSQIRTLSLHCLDFIATCLQSFNENYVAVLDRPLTEADTSIVSGSLSNSLYAQVHPFARTMKWIYGEDVSKRLMASTHYGQDEIFGSRPDSPLVIGLERSIDVLNLVLDLQSTYVDIVRPLVKDIDRSKMVPSSTITSFEDVISGHPQLVHDLCVYGGADIDALVIKSLSLLQKLSASKKLNNYFIANGTSTSKSKRVIDMLGPNANLDFLPVASEMSSHLDFGEYELEAGLEAPEYSIKDAIIAFLNACLVSQPALPNIAHLFLGFSRVGERLYLAPGSSFENGSSVFNSVWTLAKDYPDSLLDSMVSWLIHIKTASMKVLQQLWSSELSSSITVIQLRRFKTLEGYLSTQSLVVRSTLWDGLSLSDPRFWYDRAAEGLAEFLEYRAFLCEYAKTEIRLLNGSNQKSQQRQWFSTMLGRSEHLAGVESPSANIFDLFDILDLAIPTVLDYALPGNFQKFELDTNMSERTEEMPALYDVEAISEVLQMHLAQIITSAKPKLSAEEEETLQHEAQAVVQVAMAKNRLILVQRARTRALRQWIEVANACLGYCPLEAGPKIQFIMQLLNILLPKLDNLILDESADTIELVRAADAIFLALSEVPSSQIQGRTETLLTDRLFQLFRACTEAIISSSSDSELRTASYSVCSQYLSRISRSGETFKRARRNCLDTVRSAGLRLINTLSDDAEDGVEACKPSSIRLLGLLTSLARSEKSSVIIDSLVKANALELLIEPIKQVAVEFLEAVPAAQNYLLRVLEERALLLLELSRSREGANALIDAGLLSAIRESAVLTTDPDIGFDMESPDAIYTYYTLVSSFLRVLVSTFISRGLQNEQSQAQIRAFLQEYRLNMVGLFKRANGVNGRSSARSQEVLAAIVNSYTALVTMSGFVEFEEKDDRVLGGERP